MSEAIMTPPNTPATAKARGKVAPAKLAHIVFRTSRYEEMIQWYKTVLEAEIVMGSPMVTFLTYDDEHHRIAIAAQPNLQDQDRSRAGMEHCAFTYESLDDLFATYERLAAAGIKPYWTINHGGTLSMYYQDPDGNNLELQIDAFDSNEQTTQWLIESDFSVNPVGVKFEPEELIARYRAGEDKQSLLTRPVIAPDQVLAQFP